MSEGMIADVNAAKVYARTELKNNPHLLSIGREILEKRAGDEKEYRQNKAKSEWQIEIIGDMPAQIGMCRYQEATK